MDSSQSRSKNNKNKNWNIFRSPQQKDLFDFLDHQEKQELVNFNQDHKQNLIPNVGYQQSKHNQNQSSWNQADSLRQKNDLENNDENSWRSNMTFATRYNQEQSSKIKSLKNQDRFFRATHSRNTKKNILNQQEENLLLTSRPHCDDSFSNIFLKQIPRTQHNQILSTEQQKKKLFENINLKTNDNFAITYLDNNLILKTLNEIKEINKENLFVNQQILSTMQRKSFDRSIKRGKTTLVQPMIKSTQKKCSVHKHKHMASSKGFSQSRNQFFLYQKPVKTFSNNKLTQNKAIHHKKLPVNNTTQFSNLTRHFLTQNTTKLSLGERTLTSNKTQVHTQSKSTIKKAKGTNKLSSIQIDDQIEERMNEIQKIKTSLNLGLKKGYCHQLPMEKTLSKTTNKKKSRSHFIVHS